MPPVPWLVAAGYGSAGVLLLGATLYSRRRPVARLALRLGSAATVVFAAPVLMAGPGGGGGWPFYTHNVSALFYVTDHLGSVVATVRDDGTVYNHTTYMPFGEAVIVGGLGTHDQFGGEFMSQGFYALGPRYYDPNFGRFFQPDRIVPDVSDPQSHNSYSYALNSPANFIDPTGFFSEIPTEGGGSPEFNLDFPRDIFQPIGDTRPVSFPVPEQPTDSVGNVPVSSSQGGQEGVQVACGPAAPICLGIFFDALGKAALGTVAVLGTGAVIDEGSRFLAEQLGDKSIGDQVKDAEKEVRDAITGRGDDTARSGEAGSLDRKAGAGLIRLGNKTPKGPLRDALKDRGKRLIDRARGPKTER